MGQVGIKINGGTVSECFLNMVAEGVPNTISFYESTKKHQVNTPIIDQAYEMIENGKRPDKALQDLLSRDLRPETDY